MISLGGLLFVDRHLLFLLTLYPVTLLNLFISYNRVLCSL